MGSASSSSESMRRSAARSEVGRQMHIQLSSGPLEVTSKLSFEEEASVPLVRALLDSSGIH